MYFVKISKQTKKEEEMEPGTRKSNKENRIKSPIMGALGMTSSRLKERKC